MYIYILVFFNFILLLMQSVYGELCCEWSQSSEGSKSCDQRISKDHVCMCGSASSASDSSLPSEPVREPVLSPVQSPTEKKKKDHKSSGDDNWEPMPWLPFEPFKPFKPIKVPDDAPECKTHCDNPCSWSQSNGQSYCCETVSGRSCSSTQVNGKCYCA